MRARLDGNGISPESGALKPRPRFFSTLKTERTNRKHYTTRDAARADVFDYIERFYNPLRRHSTLGNVSPAKFERATAVA